MHTTIQGKHLDLGDALKQRVTERLEGAVAKYFGDAIEANTTFSKDAKGFQADCQIHVGHDIYLKSRGAAGDAHSAFDDAAEKIEKQLRRYKRRLKDHHAEQKAAGTAAAVQAYILAREADDEEDIEVGDNPTIIAESSSFIPACTVSDAVMRMDLAEEPVMLFRNLGNDRLNVVYRRTDGNIGWIDPASN